MFILGRFFLRTHSTKNHFHWNFNNNRCFNQFFARSHIQKSFYHTKIDQKDRTFTHVQDAEAFQDISSLSSSLLTAKIHETNQGSENKQLTRQEQMCLAILERNHEAAEKLFREAFQDRDEKFIYYVDQTGKNFLHLAVIQGVNQIVELLLAPKVFNLDGDIDHGGFTALHWAIHQGHESIIKKLLNHGATLTAPSKGSNESEKIFPIEMAVAIGNPAIFDLLLEQDRREQIEFSRSSCSKGNVIHISIHANQNEMLEHLLNHLSPKIQNCLEEPDALRRTPLQLASFLGDCKAIGLLCKKGVHINKGEGERGGTAVHYAAIGNHPEAMRNYTALGQIFLH